MAKMGKDYTILKLTREELLVAAGYHQKSAVYGIMHDHGAEKAKSDETQGRGNH